MALLKDQSVIPQNLPHQQHGRQNRLTKTTRKPHDRQCDHWGTGIGGHVCGAIVTSILQAWFYILLILLHRSGKIPPPLENGGRQRMVLQGGALIKRMRLVACVLFRSPR